ncbi:MAG: Ig-like domain-containing protein [Phycisphaerales bacterium]|nr:Ig-like domain-containing protein [Phycisphaerales bacterium]
MVTDGIIQRDGWFIDEVQVTAPDLVNAPPVANDVYATTPEDMNVSIFLDGSDPDSASPTFVIDSLPAHGELFDPNGGQILSVPYSLLSQGTAVQYVPDVAYQGPDAFVYRVSDGSLSSNTATAGVSVGTPAPVFSFPLDTDPDWLVEGDWAFGPPQGLEGDPASAFTGLNVLGYNLAGEYDQEMPPQYLTMQPLNCSGLSRVTLSFARWLGVEADSFDKATIEITTDGILWNTVWSHTGDDLEETAWSQQSYNLTEFADDEPFVMIRWGMGPTDGGGEFSGWNIDDIVISAIGAASPNQPPLAKNVNISTAVETNIDVTLDGSDGNGDSISFVILSLPAHGTLTDPNGGVIAAVPYELLSEGDVVNYDPLPGMSGPDGFNYQADDGTLASNTAQVSIDVLLPAQFPFADDFEAGPPIAAVWRTKSTSTGNIKITSNDGPIGSFHLALDSSSDSTFALNEVDLIADLEGHSQVLLQYDWQVFGDETHPLPESWNGSENGDGVAISVDGIMWHRIADLFDPGSGTYQTSKIDLDAAAAAAGLTYTKTFRIRFQQYDNNPIPSDGMTLDNVQLIQGTDDPTIATAFLPTAQLGVPYGPVSLSVIAGDPPYAWSLLDIYEETDVGASEFAVTGVAQGWDGDDLVFDYTLPFPFPFYGQTYTDIKIAIDGWINFGGFVGSTWNNSEVLLAFNRRIAPMWDDLRIDSGLGDIHIDESVATEVTIRWDAVVDATGDPCNFSATLHNTGRVDLHYGTGNTSLTPTIGVSSGDGATYVLAAYDGAVSLTNANSLEFEYMTLPPGISVDGDGMLSGTPTVAGMYGPFFHVEDASARTDTKQISLLVSGLQFGDFDEDTDVDEDDFAQFRICYTGQDGGPVSALCAAGDSDGDTDVDCADWAAFKAAFLNSSGYTPALSIDDFIDALLDPEADEVNLCLGDTSENGTNDGDDIQMFIEDYLSAP